MLCENDIYIIPDNVKRMSPEQRKIEAMKAYAEMKKHPVIHKKPPLKNGLRFNFKTSKKPS